MTEKQKDQIEDDDISNEEFLKMSDDHWESEDPEFFKMMMKHREKHVSDKKTT